MNLELERAQMGTPIKVRKYKGKYRDTHELPMNLDLGKFSGCPDLERWVS